MTLLEEIEQSAEYLALQCHPECARKMRAAADEIRKLSERLALYEGPPRQACIDIMLCPGQDR